MKIKEALIRAKAEEKEFFKRADEQKDFLRNCGILDLEQINKKELSDLRSFFYDKGFVDYIPTNKVVLKLLQFLKGKRLLF